jgi:hypothetical protein
MNALGRWVGLLSRSIVIALFVAGSAAQADDFAPPSWRPVGTPIDPTSLAPVSVYSEWDFSTSFSQFPSQFSFGQDPDGHTGPIAPYLDKQPLATFVPLGGMNFGMNPSDLYTFCVPNWIDEIELKCMRIQLTYMFTPSAPGAHPAVKNIMAFDLSFVEPSNPMGMVPPGNITNKAVSTPDEFAPDKFHQLSDWQIIPNPDWEKFEVHVPVGVMLQQVVVDTISIPEPAAFLFGGVVCGVIGLGWGGRRMLRAFRH